MNSSDRFYRIWQQMRQRTTNPNHKDFKYYGGRTINSDAYCDFSTFFNDMYDSYLEHVKIHGEKDTTIDRIDSDMHYTKDNLKWSTREEQSRNRSSNVEFIATAPDGTMHDVKCVPEFAALNGLDKSAVYRCLNKKAKSHKGWTFARMLKEDQIDDFEYE